MAVIQQIPESRQSLFESIDTRLHWLATYTYPRHEKRVAEQLFRKGLEVYLPIYRARRLWNQRRAIVDLPLFPGYIFVKIRPSERMRVLETAGVAYIVSANGVPVPLSETEVSQVRECFSRNLDIEPCEYLPGTRVRVTAGPLTGLEGVIVRQNGKARFIISVDLIMRSVAVSVEAADVEAVTEIRLRAA